MNKCSNGATQDLTCALCQHTFTPAVTSHYDLPGLCPSCFSRDHYRELDRIISAKRKLPDNIPADLSLPQWLTIVAAWSGKCALCGLLPYQVLEVWIPALGVTSNNVVPTCRSCSFHKEHSFLSAMERVQAVLSEGIQP